jgi:hypothetical protein
MLTQAAYNAANLARACRNILLPYFRYRLHPDDFQPLIAYLYTDLD